MFLNKTSGRNTSLLAAFTLLSYCAVMLKKKKRMCVLINKSENALHKTESIMSQ